MPLPALDDLVSSDALLDLRAAARDAWPGGLLAAWQGEPQVLPDRVFWPEDAEQVHALLEEASRRRVPVVTYGAGSGVCGGAGGRAGAWVLDTKRLQHLGPVDRERWVVEVGAGVNGQQLEDALLAQGFTLGHSPSSIWCSTVGGWLAARSAGQFSSRYGVIEDMVVGLEAVAPGRGVFRVGDPAVVGEERAPDAWMDALLGSEGTLAVITRAWLRVSPAPSTRWLRGYRFPDVASALRAMREVMQGELWPAVLRLYDPIDTLIGGKTKPAHEHKEGGGIPGWLKAVDAIPAVRRNSLALPLRLPGLINELFGRFASGCLLVAGWEGDEGVVHAAAAEGHRILEREGEDLGVGPGERWFASRHAVSYKLMPIFERGGFADTMEVACRWSDMERLYHAVRDAVRPTAVVMAHMSHAYPEGASIYFSFAGLGDRAVYERTWQGALAACLSVGATTTHHHGVGALKAETASREVGPAVAGWRALRAELDPSDILNPGRLFVEVPPEAPPASRPPNPFDGLVQVPVGADLEARRRAAAPAEVAWPWEEVQGPPRWQRLAWQTSWIGLEGTIGGQPCRLGRAPRSAAGPDLRGWLASNADDARAEVGAAPPGDRWLGRGTPDAPWAVARELLRGDLRPAFLTVQDGALLVGFRGPAARAFGALAAARIPGGLVEVPWTPPTLPSRDLVPCAIDDPGVVAVLPSGALKRAETP